MRAMMVMGGAAGALAVAAIGAGPVAACPVVPFQLIAAEELPPNPTVYVALHPLAPRGARHQPLPIRVEDASTHRPVPTSVRPLMFGFDLVFAVTIEATDGQLDLAAGPAPPDRAGSTIAARGPRVPVAVTVHRSRVVDGEPVVDLDLHGDRVAFWAVIPPGCPSSAVRGPTVTVPTRCLGLGGRLDLLAYRFDGSFDRVTVQVPSDRPCGGSLVLLAGLAALVWLVRRRRRPPVTMV